MVKVVGIEELKRSISSFSLEMQDKILKASVRDNSKPVKEKYALNTPEGPTGNLVDSVSLWTKTKSTNSVASVGYSIKGRKKGYHGHLRTEGIAGKSRTTKNDVVGKTLPTALVARENIIKSVEKIVKRYEKKLNRK
jgi:hypothetical protein